MTGESADFLITKIIDLEAQMQVLEKDLFFGKLGLAVLVAVTVLFVAITLYTYYTEREHEWDVELAFLLAILGAVTVGLLVVCQAGNIYDTLYSMDVVSSQLEQAKLAYEAAYGPLPIEVIS